MFSKKLFATLAIIFYGIFLFSLPTAVYCEVFYWLKPVENWAPIKDTIQKTLDADLWGQPVAISSRDTASSLAAYLAGKTTTCVKLKVGREVFEGRGTNFRNGLAYAQIYWRQKKAREKLLQNPGYKKAWEELNRIYALNGWVIRPEMYGDSVVCDLGEYSLAIYPAAGTYVVYKGGWKLLEKVSTSDTLTSALEAIPAQRDTHASRHRRK